MNSALTISLALQDGLLTARVRGSADELAEGARIVDAVRAESVRVGATRALVDFGALGGTMTLEYQSELEEYAAARLGRLKCALVLPPDCAVDPAPPPEGAKFAVFGALAGAFEWLQARRAGPGPAAPRARPEHTLVHLL
jgi:hypothetical protein